MQFEGLSNGEARSPRWSAPKSSGLHKSGLHHSGLHKAGVVRFMLAIDNFDHVSAAYGTDLADLAVRRVRAAIEEWLGDRAEIHFESAGVFYGTLHRPLSDATESGAAADGAAVRPGEALSVNRLLINPPVVFLSHDGGTICLSLAGSWAVHDGLEPSPTRRFEGGCRAAFFGEPPARGASWVERYRADMALAAVVLTALPGDEGPREHSAKGPAVPAQTPVSYSTAGAVFRVFEAMGRGSGVVQPIRQPTGAEPLVLTWRPVRDGYFGQDVLFYEMVPQLCGRDGQRRDLVDSRPALERLGLAVALDQYMVNSALDLLEADPDVAIAVQVSAQSVSSCARWGGLFRRLTGSSSVANRLIIAITETTSFPGFAEAVQFVSRLQAFGCAVAVDNFGLGYQVEVFDSGAALLDRARAGMAGCIVLDVRMPGVSGLEVQKRLAALDIHTPVIVVSGFADIEMAVQAMKANAVEFLSKPFRDQDLFDAIGAAMELDSSRSTQSRERRQADRLIGSLTSREHEVFVRLCHGQLGKQIAHELGMSEATVKVHRRSILHKLNVRHLGELILTYAPLVKSLGEDASRPE
ncbi:response regulator [Novosphingobium sp.]|uniref:response regulator n=1 Tax=Novosphingobium sp. TaxID=1874826 RepID=UPI002639B81B|nr:response regulator [Novosphingobium sp.]